MSICRLVTTLITLGICGSPVAAQQVTIGSPNVNVSNNFFENFGIGFNGNVGGLQFNQGLGGVQPQFGGFDPAAGANGGIGIGGGGFNGNLNFSLAQGSNTSLTSTTPMVTTMNGQPGMISDQVQIPFVLGVTPIVNGRPRVPRFGYQFLPQQMSPTESVSPVVERYRRLQQSGGVPSSRAKKPQAEQLEPQDDFQQRLVDAQHSTAGQGALSVREIRKQQSAAVAAEDAQALEDFRRGEQAEKEGKVGAAKIFYRMAYRRAAGELKQRAAQRLYLLSESDK